MNQFANPEISLIICTLKKSSLTQNLKFLSTIKDPQIEVIILESTTHPRRYEGYSLAKGSYLVFIDADCEILDTQIFRQIVTTFKAAPRIGVIAGLYASPNRSGYLSRAYNLLCNSWIYFGLSLLPEEMQIVPSQNFLGGAFALNKLVLSDLQPLHFGATWGGEDTYLARRIRDLNVPIVLLGDFQVYHHASQSLKKWVRRAFYHGQKRYELNLKTNGKYKNLPYLSLIYFSPALLLHQTLVLLGSSWSFICAHRKSYISQTASLDK